MWGEWRHGPDDDGSILLALVKYTTPQKTIQDRTRQCRRTNTTTSIQAIRHTHTSRKCSMLRHRPRNITTTGTLYFPTPL